ncbi:hypothetical protein GGTG_10698 [Gaeumannomyces tritici R3-111a-1]|uniref:SET domain-containing protein n=1 Tax=Gaeumannomyces tritici (strain R3-111a-1) TaxID=644352 RepID=J3PB24_GAET3|nr:hypothetical protein GGTG_10698 [Gaeumannomyces tritici R3-111a-1]EJT71440.1 hypothetical protein GGTG_10698 [Gaeumannomyces tritici R3-111a-1]
MPFGHRGRLDSPGFTKCTPPLDDTTATDDPSTWAPWTHRPVCINSTKLEVIHHDAGGDNERNAGVPEAARADDTRRFCVYTNVHLGDGGLSIITTPEQAADSLHLFEDPNLPAALYSAANDGGGAQRYKVVDIPEKGGKGVVATRAIRRFEPIILESGVVLADTDFPRAVERTAGYRLLHEAVDRLPEATVRAVMGLARGSAFARDEVEDVLRTNAFAGELGGQPHMTLFPAVSVAKVGELSGRLQMFKAMADVLNPSAFPRFSRRSVVTAIVAARDIKPGEEITITYSTTTNHINALPDSSLGLPYDERQERLKTVWGFECTCDQCAVLEPERAASDRRLADVQRKRREIVSAIGTRDAARAVRLCHEVLDALATEDLPALFAEEYEVLARVHHLVGRDADAVRYARMALKVLGLYGSLDRDDEYVAVEGLLSAFSRPRVPAGGESPGR